MPGLEAEELYQSDSSDNEEGHSKLISSVSQLDSTQRVKPAQRREIASEVSEFNLGKSLGRKNVVNVKELTEVLGRKANHEVISKKIETITRNSRTLPKPVEKVTEERLQRSIEFENVKRQLGRWDAIVERNSLKDRISFPLNQNSVRMQRSNEFLSQFKSNTPLEEELAKLLQPDNTKETEKEEDEFPLTLEEMMEKRREMARLRAKLSYRERAAARQKKIKSKKYHRLLKREKIRQQLKEFEILQKTDPEAALKKLSELDKTRAMERASLRHRNTGHWAKNLSVRAKYDVETRKVLADQLKMSRELTQKVSQLESSDDEEEAADAVLPENGVQGETKLANIFGDNPWTLDVSNEVKDFVSGYKKYWSEQQKQVNQVRANEVEMKGSTSGDKKVLNKESNAQVREVLDKESNADDSEVLDKESNAEGGEVLEKEDNGKATRESPVREKSNVCNGVEKASKISPKKLPKIKSPKKELQKEVKKEKAPKKLKKEKVETKVEKKKVLKEVKKKKIQKEVEKKKASPKRKKSFVSIQPTSGVWVVEEVNDSEVSRKRKGDDIDGLFDELNQGLMAKAKKRAKQLKTKLRKLEKKNKKLQKEEEERSRFDTSLKNPNIIERPDMDKGLLEEGEDVLEEDSPAPIPVPESKTPEAIDPQNFIQLKPKKLGSQLSDIITGNEEALDDEEKDQQMIIEEAFAGDDVMAEFQEMKAEEEKKNQIEIETSLPGWGSWGGTGIAPVHRKKRLLVLNAPPRKDKHKQNVIINENENPNLKNHLVKEVPHPFKSVEAFEANIRAPIGRDWVPETAHRKFIQKQVVTKLGAVIEPMSEEEIVRAKKTARSPYQGKKKKNT